MLDPDALLLAVIVIALIFDFANGWNDSANAIATVVSTRVLSPTTAVVFAAILNFVGAFASTKVAKTIGCGLVILPAHCEKVVLSAMIAAAGWVIICTLFGLPISGSHSLLGGLFGSALTTVGLTAIKWKGIVSVLLALFISPLFGFIGGYLLLIAVYWIAFPLTPAMVRRIFSTLQIFSSGFMAYSHGLNDAQKVMGIITMALVTAGRWPSPEAGVPIWVIAACALAMALGTALGGWRVIRTLGMRLAHIRPIEGCAAESAAASVLTVAAALGMPVSTTHTITGSILGVGAAEKAKAVRWGIGAKILIAWLLTLPGCAILGAAFAEIFVTIS
ncbi:MAG: inorganic phosphate transporter [Planctomycetota bacterium]|nr:inorganic phosphate transporter [Planctomycetota bacterium]